MGNADSERPETTDPSESRQSTADLAFHLSRVGFAQKDAWRLRNQDDRDARTDRGQW